MEAAARRNWFLIFLGLILIAWGVGEVTGIGFWPLVLVAFGAYLILAGISGKAAGAFEEKFE